jgi:predicted phosphate transport protein (TIGR00153 family)
MKFSFLPAEDRYYTFFEQASANQVEAARCLLDLLEHFDNIQERVGQITELEHKGDQIVHEVTNLLPRTLITPIDLEDILRIISALDDGVDTIEEAARRLMIYQVKAVHSPARELARLIVESATELDAALRELRSKDTYQLVNTHIVQVNTLENQADDVLDNGLIELVEQRGDVYEYMHWKELYQLLERVTDRIEDAGDVIQRVVLANA